MWTASIAPLLSASATPGPSLFGHASALRRLELVALTRAGIEDKPPFLMLHVRRSETDPRAPAHDAHPPPRRVTDAVLGLVSM